MISTIQRSLNSYDVYLNTLSSIKHADYQWWMDSLNKLRQIMKKLIDERETIKKHESVFHHVNKIDICPVSKKIFIIRTSFA